MKIWKIKENANSNNLLQDLLGKYNPIILQLLKSRGLKTSKEIEKYFNFDYEKDLNDPLQISGIEKAIKRIIEAKDKNQKIAIFGDYDADGVSASALLHETLTDLGFENIICYIPDRQLEGYGMNENAIEYLKDQHVNLIITVDSGITNITEIKKANELGMDVIITDHHHVPEVLPEAYVVINPNIPNSGFPFKDLAGVGVAFKLAQALYQKIQPKKIHQLKWLLDLVALGTIADCVSLLGENRTLVKYGLIVLSKTKRAGFKEIFKVGKINISENSVPDTHKVAFQIAPRINAAGRMDHANAAYGLLIEKDRVSARDMALELESKNKQRQKITAEIFREVQVLAENSFKDKKFIFAENPHWPVGILGLVAGKITDEFQKPSVILQRQEQKFVGSLRSIPEINIIKILEKCSEVIVKFGGHSQAAGVVVETKNIEKFFQKMSHFIEEELAGREIFSVLEIDAEIIAKDISWELMAELKKMEPFGKGNEEPLFLMKNMQIVDYKVVGNGNKHLKLSLRGEGRSPKIFDAIGFSLAEKFSKIKKDDKIDIVFNLQEDKWNENKKMQLKIVDMKMN